MSHEFRIKPLSEGLGLGSLRTPTPRGVSQDHPVDRSTQQELPAIDIQTMERAHHAVYRQQSVSAKMKAAPKARVGVWLARALVGWGLDGIVVCLTVFVCAVLGIMSWRFGSGATTSLDPIDALKVMTAFVSLRGVKVIGIAFVVIWVVYRFVMKGLVGSTLGTTLTRDSF